MTEKMLETGLDYILNAAKQMGTDAGEDQNSSVRYSLLHLYAGIELIFRARLYAENWTYIFLDMDEADKERLSLGNYRPVDFTGCIDRLERLCGIRISAEAKRNYEYLIRKKILAETVRSTGDMIAVETVMYHALCSIAGFIDDEKKNLTGQNEDGKKQRRWSPAVKSLLNEIRQSITVMQGRHYDVLMSASGQVTEKVAMAPERRAECPSCGEVFLIPASENGKCHCYYCGFEADGESAAKQYLSNVKNLNERRIIKDGGIYPLFSCPTCRKRSLVPLKDKNLCFSCGRLFENTETGHKTVIPRQAEGIAAAKKRGVKFGRPQRQLPENFAEVYTLWADGKLSNREAATKLNMPVSTFRNRAEEYRKQKKGVQE